MTDTTKQASYLDQNQVLRNAYNQEGATLGVDGFVVGKIGRKVTRVVSTTTVTDDTEIFTFIESGATLYELTIIYTDGTKDNLLSVERTA
jgi:hypothetical protein